ncbi:hypothetical protein [Commensalibacter papalotli (ex Servin-Garciduenas et al. 2014)]|uniref:Uncharacterized protein n=1 Tax=Commensalibacter papalotli (ex Servin-Garciduenas et al. 2014) TaxID=1208583 RepID=W7E2C9_9PROT|nr:hypothetical protein [Commensalibacter papalotli (ex Servin-Garciduenas et al. 2014)]EUK19259.1 hypothetical protein COMX_05895 [Commensalibacter papalotli (ex Servin-Garciduenas et al. 2014)]
MTDIKVKPTRKKAASVKKTVKVKKLKASDKTSAAVDGDLIDEEDDTDQLETECLLRTSLSLKNACFEQEETSENNVDIDNFQPIDKLMTSEVHNKISDIHKTVSIIEEDNQDYIVIGCRFPNGVVVNIGNNKILLRGINDMSDQDKAKQDKNVGFTKIARPVWNSFLKTHKNWPPLLNGSVFVMNRK